MFKLLASTPINIGRIGGIGKLGDSLNETPSTIFTRIARFFSNIIGLLTLAAGLWFIIQIFIAGYNWISAGGDKQQLQLAQKKITNSIMGLFIVVAAYTFIGIIGLFLGLNILNIEIILALLKP